MITVTQDASAFLSSLLEKAEAPDGTMARLRTTADGVQLQLDEPNEEDHSVEHDGRVVLVVDPDTSETLDGRTLRLHQSDDGPQLAIE